MKLSKPLILFVALTLLSEGAFSFEPNCTSNCTAPASPGMVTVFVFGALGLVTLTFGGVYWVNERLAECDQARIMTDFQTYGTDLQGTT